MERLSEHVYGIEMFSVRGDGQAAVAYPGPVILGLNALLAEGGAPPSARLPTYPLFVEARTGAKTSVRDDHTVPGSLAAATDEPLAAGTRVSPAWVRSPASLSTAAGSVSGGS